MMLRTIFLFLLALFMAPNMFAIPTQGPTLDNQDDIYIEDAFDAAANRIPDDYVAKPLSLPKRILLKIATCLFISYNAISNFCAKLVAIVKPSARTT